MTAELVVELTDAYAADQARRSSTERLVALVAGGVLTSSEAERSWLEPKGMTATFTDTTSGPFSTSFVQRPLMASAVKSLHRRSPAELGAALAAALERRSHRHTSPREERGGWSPSEWARLGVLD